MKQNRLERVNALIQIELSKLLRPLIESKTLPTLTTITYVKTSADLSIAKVYVVFHDETDVKPHLKILQENAKTLRYQLAQEVNLRKTPELRFYYDDSITKGNRIDQLLKAENV